MSVVALDVPRLGLRRSVILNDPVKIFILDLESRIFVFLKGNGMKSFGSINGLSGSSNGGQAVYVEVTGQLSRCLTVDGTGHYPGVEQGRQTSTEQSG